MKGSHGRYYILVEHFLSELILDKTYFHFMTCLKNPVTVARNRAHIDLRDYVQFLM